MEGDDKIKDGKIKEMIGHFDKIIQDEVVGNSRFEADSEIAWIVCTALGFTLAKYVVLAGYDQYELQVAMGRAYRHCAIDYTERQLQKTRH